MSESYLGQAEYQHQKEVIIDEVFSSVYCGDTEMPITDEYDEEMINRAAARFFAIANIEKQPVDVTTWTNVPGEDIPGTVLGTVVSQAMFRPESNLSVDEKWEIFFRALSALIYVGCHEDRGDIPSFLNVIHARGNRILKSLARDREIIPEDYERVYAIYSDFYDNEYGRSVRVDPGAYEPLRPLRKIGNALLGGVILMGGSVYLGPEHQVDGDTPPNYHDTDDDDDDDNGPPYYH